MRPSPEYGKSTLTLTLEELPDDLGVIWFPLFLRYTCPFVEKFSIDIETYYKPDTGDQGDVFSMSAAEKRQRTVGKCSSRLLLMITDQSSPT